MRVAAIALFTLACPSPSPEPGDWQRIALLVSDLVRASAEDARQLGPAGSTGSVMADRLSMERSLRHLTADASGTAPRLRDSTFQLASKTEAIRCTTDTADPCEVVRRGIFVTIDSVEVVGTTAMALVTSTTTERRPSGLTGLCPRQLLLRLEYGTSGWTVAQRDVIAVC
jgi:hypothetical protein